MSNTSLQQLAKSIGVPFSNTALLQQAVTHRSYLNEHKGAGLEHNERLEFLGDAVLELAVTDKLFHEYPTSPEGELTAYRAALVNTQSLTVIAEELNLNTYILLSKGEAKDTGRARHYIIANAVEALIGAIYLDQGYAAAEKFIAKYFYPRLEKIIAERLWQDAKSHFQEKAQEKVGITPTYKLLEESGPDHNKVFRIGVFLKGEEIAVGVGKSKQEAEQDAAKNGLVAKKW